MWQEGVCVTDEEGHLLKINERTHIEKHDGGTAYTRRWKNMDYASGRQYSIHEYVGIFSKHSERAERRIS